MLLNVSRYNLLYNFCAILYLCTYINIYVLCTPSVIWYNMRGVKSLNLAIGPKSIQSWDKPCQLVSWRRHGPKHPLLQTWVAGWFRSPRIGVNGSWFLLISWLLWRSYSPISNVPRWLNGGKHWEKHSRWQIQVNKWWIFFFSVDTWQRQKSDWEPGTNVFCCFGIDIFGDKASKKHFVYQMFCMCSLWVCCGLWLEWLEESLAFRPSSTVFLDGDFNAEIEFDNGATVQLLDRLRHVVSSPTEHEGLFCISGLDVEELCQSRLAGARGNHCCWDGVRDSKITKSIKES